MVEGGEVPTPHLFQIQMQLIWEEAGDAQSLLHCECATSPPPRGFVVGEGRRGEGEGWRGEREEAQPPSGYVGLGVLVLPPQVGSIAA